MENIKHFFSTHKALVTVLSGVLTVLIITGVVFFIFKGPKSKENKQDTKKQEENEQELLEELNQIDGELSSEEDEVYEEETLNKNKKEYPYLIKVNKRQNCITVYQKDSTGSYTVPLKAMICSVGFDTPIGTYTTSDKYTWKILNGNTWGQYATRITGNVLFHSSPYSSKDKGTLISKYYNNLGSNQSAGSISLTVQDAKWLMENCPKGTTVEIYEDAAEGPLGKPEAFYLSTDAAWDPTDEDGSNPWKGNDVKLEGVEDFTSERGMTIDYLKNVKATDTCGNDITDKVIVTTDADIYKNGTYTVHYSVTDAMGKTVQKDIVMTISDTQAPGISGLRSSITASDKTEVTKEQLLSELSLIDNNERLSNDRITVTIPNLVEGKNTIQYSATDDYGNTTTATNTVILDNQSPVITLNKKSSVISLNTEINDALARSYVSVKDGGTEMSADAVKIEITNDSWGYTFHYRATDEFGNTTTFKTSVTYAEYSIEVNGDKTVTDITDEKQLLDGVVIHNNMGGTITGVDVNVKLEDNKDGTYKAIYTYEYTSPLGSRTAQAEGKVILKQNSKTAGN